jgi:hypothetical protein
MHKNYSIFVTPLLAELSTHLILRYLIFLIMFDVLVFHKYLIQNAAQNFIN